VFVTAVVAILSNNSIRVIHIYRSALRVLLELCVRILNLLASHATLTPVLTAYYDSAAITRTKNLREDKLLNSAIDGYFSISEVILVATGSSVAGVLKVIARFLVKVIGAGCLGCCRSDRRGSALAVGMSVLSARIDTNLRRAVGV
jgi:hypothetical protein